MTAKRTTVPHDHYVLHVGGVLRATCSCHFWLPIEQAATTAKAAS